MVEHTQTIRGKFADKLFERVWSFCEIGALTVNKESYRKLAAVLKVCQRWRRKKNTKTGIALDLDLTLPCGFFFKVVFFEGVSPNKIKSQKIRCRSWSAVPLQHYLLNEKSIRFHDTHFIEHLKSIPKMTK